MKTFDLYRHPTLGYEAVKRGFAWPGFFIGAIWALTKRMWLGGTLLLFAWVFLLGARSDAQTKGDAGGALVLLVIMVVLAITAGMIGNGRWAQSLIRRGYEHLGTGDADEPDAAVAAFVRKAAVDSAPSP